MKHLKLFALAALLICALSGSALAQAGDAKEEETAFTVMEMEDGGKVRLYSRGEFEGKTIANLARMTDSARAASIKKRCAKEIAQIERDRKAEENKPEGPAGLIRITDPETIRRANEFFGKDTPVPEGESKIVWRFDYFKYLGEATDSLKEIYKRDQLYVVNENGVGVYRGVKLDGPPVIEHYDDLKRVDVLNSDDGDWVLLDEPIIVYPDGFVWLHASLTSTGEMNVWLLGNVLEDVK